MAIVLKPKKSETASAVPTTSDLAVGEICMNIADRKIYTRKSDNSIVVIGSHVDAAVGGDVTGTVSNIQIAADAITSAEIADNAVDSEHYTDGSIDNIHTNFQPGTTFKGDGSSASGKLVLNCEQNTHGVSIQSPAHSAGATYTLTLPTSDGAASEVLMTDGSGVLSWTSVGGAVTGTVANIQIAADAITNAKIADNAIDSEHYTDGSIDTAHLADGAITAAKIADGTVVAAEIADDAITTAKILDANVTTAKIAADAITSALIVDDAIDSEHLVNGSVDDAHISGMAASKLTGTITPSDNTVTGAKIALGSDAAGDVMYYNGTDYVRLAKGTAGQVLTVNSGATAPEWAADSTNVSGTSLGGVLGGTVGNATIDANAVGVTELNVSDGTNGQVLKTNGSGTLSFTTITPGVSEATATSKAVTMAIALG